jgi:hypothetical protein
MMACLGEASLHFADECSATTHGLASPPIGNHDFSAVTVVSFADFSHRKGLRRLAQQVHSFGFSRPARLLTERDLDPSFVQIAASKWGKLDRGFGYYFWKPQVILQELSRLQPGEIMLYLDAGCHLNPGGKKRMADYLRWTSRSDSGILAFQYRPSAGSELKHDSEFYTDRQYSKKLVRDHFSISDGCTVVLDSGQVASGVIFLRSTEMSLETVRLWRDTFLDNPSIFDDSTQSHREDAGFVEPRHDQSVWSILLKTRGGDTVSAFERWVPRYAGREQDWNLLSDYPIWAKRDLPESRLSPMLRRISSVWNLFTKRRTPFVQ